MMPKLDRYSLLIISKYFKSSDDFINAMLTNKKFEDVVDMFHFNPISIINFSKKLFHNIETQHVYTKYDEILPNLFSYIVWYPSTVKTIKHFENKYKIRPIFKQLRVDYSFGSTFKKKEGDLLIISNVMKNSCNGPKTVDCSDFIKIKAKTFYCSQIKEIKLGKHINTITSHCFFNCPLNSIDLSNVTRIEDGSFEFCKQLTSVTLSKHLEVMDVFCFNHCSSLKTVVISDNSKEFGLDVTYELFNTMKNNGIQCTGNVWITRNKEIPTNIVCKTIDSNQISEQEVVEFNSIQIIPSYLFMYDYYDTIKQIILSSNIISIEIPHYCKLRSLESINLENVKYICFKCFEGCSKLKEVNISNTRYLGRRAFFGCLNLTTVTYSSYLNYIPNNCFRNCQRLKEIIGMEGVNEIRWHD